MEGGGLTEAIEELRATISAELQPVLDALLGADPDDSSVEDAWQRLLQEALHEA